MARWDIFCDGNKAFGGTERHVRQATEKLKNLAQKSGESDQPYIQIRAINPKMGEEMLFHLMIGVTEDLCQTLL